MRILIIALTFISFGIEANGWLTNNGSARITKISIENDVVRIDYTADDIQDPDGCGNKGVAMIQDETKLGDRQFSVLLAAHMSNKPIRLYGYDCYTGWGQKWPKIGSVTVE